MPNTKKTKKDQFDLSSFEATLNFAYCPSDSLIINSSLMQNSQEFIDLSKGLDKKSISYMTKAMRYFYICYCIKLENHESFKESNYFYFQLFSQIGDQQTASQPIYGFHSDEKTLDLIKDIDSMFNPDQYDKCIFDTFQGQITAKANEIIGLMEEWTKAKLLTFNNSYFNDNEAVENLYLLIKRGNKAESSKKDKKDKKDKTVGKNKEKEITKINKPRKKYKPKTNIDKA
jgi:hypothetical protein